MTDNSFEMIRGGEFLSQLAEFRLTNPNILILEIEAVGNAKGNPPAGLNLNARIFRPSNGDFIPNPASGNIDINGDHRILEFKNTFSINYPGMPAVIFQDINIPSSLRFNPFPGKMIFVLGINDVESLRESLHATFSSDDVRERIQKELLVVYNNDIEITEDMARECFEVFLATIAQESFSENICSFAN